MWKPGNCSVSEKLCTILTQQASFLSASYSEPHDGCLHLRGIAVHKRAPGHHELFGERSYWTLPVSISKSLFYSWSEVSSSPFPRIAIACATGVARERCWLSLQGPATSNRFLTSQRHHRPRLSSWTRTLAPKVWTVSRVTTWKRRHPPLCCAT